MGAYSVVEAKNNLSRLIDLVLQGEPVTITRRGAPVVELRPARGARGPVSAEALMQLRNARANLRVSLEEESYEFVSRMRDEEWWGGLR